MAKRLLALYIDYLLLFFRVAPARGLSALETSAVSPAPVTRFVLGVAYDSQTRWPPVKPLVWAVEQADGVLIVDDTIQESRHTIELSLRPADFLRKRRQVHTHGFEELLNNLAGPDGIHLLYPNQSLRQVLLRRPNVEGANVPSVQATG